MRKFLPVILAVVFLVLALHLREARAALTLSANAVTGDGVLTLQGTSLAVVGDTTFSKTITAGGTAVNPARYFNVAITDNTSSAVLGGEFAVTRTDSTIGFNLTGSEGNASLNTASSGSTAIITGARGFAKSTGGGGTNGAVYGGFFLAWNVNNGSGVVATIAGVHPVIQFLGSGVTTSARGIDVSEWTLGGSSTVANSYGLYMDTSIDVGTTRYAIYSLSTSQSYLQGNLGIGTATPGAKFDVKDGHIASTQTTPPGASVTGSGYSAASMGAGSTDTKGGITATVGAAAGTLVVTFNSAYATAPYCTVTPAAATAQVDVIKMYATTSTSALTLNFTATPTGGSETWTYHCIQ